MKIAFLSHLDMNLYQFRLPIMIELVKNGHEVYAICPRGDFFDKFLEYGIKAIEYKIDRISLNPFKEITTIKAIYEIIKPLNLDILHSFTVKPNIYGSIAGSFAKVKVIINSVTGLGSFFIQQTLKAKIVRKLIINLYKIGFSKANGVIFQNSDDMNMFLNMKLLPKEKAHLIKGSGLDIDYFNLKNIDKNEIDELKKTICVDEKIVVMMVARAIWDKGIREYYEASDILSKKYENVKFILIGGVDKGNLTSTNEEFLKSGSVLWLGERKDIKNLLSLCDIFVLPSYREGFPRTIMEACSLNKPIVTTNTVGCKEAVDDGYNGFLCNLKDSHDLSLKIEKLIVDRDLREKMGKNSRKKAEDEFDVKIVIDAYLKLYKELLHKVC
ncbi:MAG: glycosyltransferase family 4 protein [Campylobacterales bacterium]|nr:glycosyltransferase family 4 protein [Campylobacterales bacterium]